MPMNPAPLVSGPMAIAATPAGDRVFVNWADRALLIGTDGQGATILKSSAVEWGGTPAPGQFASAAAFDGSGFSVFASWEVVKLLRFDVNGDAIGPAMDVVPPSPPRIPEYHLMPGSAALAVDGGVAFAWWDESPGLFMHATLVRADGTLAHDTILGSGALDAFTGEGPTASLAAYDGDVYALSTSALRSGTARITRLGWSDGAPWTTVVDGTSGESVSWPLLVSGNRLLFANDRKSTTVLYAGTPADGFSPIWTFPQRPVAQAVDGCGRFVALASEDDPSGGRQLVAHALRDATPPVVLSHMFTVGGTQPLMGPAVVGLPTGFGVVWQDNAHTLVYATLSWR